VANLPSAKKRTKQNERDRVRNRARRSTIKTETRRFLDAIHQGDLQKAQDLFVSVTRKIDQVTAKGTLHRNTAARNKSQLARRLNAALAAKTG
jgi:small subunit ribosomal protein S20